MAGENQSSPCFDDDDDDDILLLLFISKLYSNDIVTKYMHMLMSRNK